MTSVKYVIMRIDYEPQIHVYEGNDILTLINQVKSAEPQSTQNCNCINSLGSASQVPLSSADEAKLHQAPLDSIKPNGPSKLFKKNHPKSQKDKSWKTSTEGNLKFEIKDNVPIVNLSAESLKAQRDEIDKQIEERLKAAKNDINIQKWIRGVQI